MLLAAAGASGGSTLSRKQADAIAMRVLRPQADTGEVIVFGLPRPLPRGAVVAPADPARRSLGKRVRSRIEPLGAPAWLYWLDRVPDARFSHASEYVLIEDRTGRVVRRAKLGWYPTVNGKPPAFLASDVAYESAAFRVWARLDRPTTRRVAAAAAEPLSVVPKAAFKNDCILMFGDYHSPGFAQDFTAVEAFGSWAGIRSFYTTRDGPKRSAPGKGDPAVTGSDLRSSVDTLVERQECTDVLLYLDGHGEKADYGAPTVFSSTNVEIEVDGQVEKLSIGVTADDVASIIGRHPAVGFKLKIDSCYSGRFLDELAPGGKPKLKNLLIGEASSRANEVSFHGRDTYDETGKKLKKRADNPKDLGEFTNHNLTGLYAWASSQTEVAASVAAGGSLLANGLERAFTLGRSVNAGIGWGAHPVAVRGEAGEPVKVSVNTFGLGSDFRSPWLLAWVDNGTRTGAMVFTDRAGSQVGALDPASGRADRFPLGTITNPNGIAAIDPFRFAVAGYGGVAIFDRTPPGKITELQMAGTRLVNLAVAENRVLYASDVQNNQLVSIRPPYGGPADVTKTPLPSACRLPTGIVPTAVGLTVLCQQTNNIVFLDASGSLTRSVALPTPNIGAQEPRPTGRTGIVFSGFGSNRLYRYRGNSLQSAESGRGPAVPTVAYYPDDYDDLFARQTTHDYAFVPHFNAGGATVAEFNRSVESERLSILASRNLVGSGIGPGCSPWVADATAGRPSLHRVRFPVPGAPIKPRLEGPNRLDLPPSCFDFTDASRTGSLSVRLPTAWQRTGRVEVGLFGYRGDPWRAKGTFPANFPLQLSATATGGSSGKPRVTLKGTGAYTALATVTGIPPRTRTVTLTITSRGTEAPFGLLTAARVRR
jgi:hypothetical protein